MTHEGFNIQLMGKTWTKGDSLQIDSVLKRHTRVSSFLRSKKTKEVLHGLKIQRKLQHR